MILKMEGDQVGVLRGHAPGNAERRGAEGPRMVVDYLLTDGRSKE